MKTELDLAMKCKTSEPYSMLSLMNARWMRDDFGVGGLSIGFWKGRGWEDEGWSLEHASSK
jgi:hypothetical protein